MPNDPVENYTIPDPEYLKEGYPILRRSDLHTDILKLFIVNPDKDFRMSEVAKRFPSYNPETIRVHMRKLRDQGAIVSPKDFFYRLNERYRTTEDKRQEIADHIAAGRSKLRVLTGQPTEGFFPRVEGTATNPEEEQQPVGVSAPSHHAPAAAPATVSSAVEMLKRHLSSIYTRLDAHKELFTSSDVEVLKELEIMAGL